MKLLKGIIITILGLIAILYITDTDYLLKAVRTVYAKGYTTAFLEDYKEFDNAEILNGTPQPWPIHNEYNSVSETERLKKYNDAYGTIAYVIIKNDSIWFENYYDGFDEDSSVRYIDFRNYLFTRGGGLSFQAGMIYKLKNVRIGVSYESPTWFKIEDELEQKIEVQTVDKITNEIIISINVKPLFIYISIHFIYWLAL